MRSAIITDGIVTNVIVGQIEGSIECPPTVSIGWLYDGETFTAPEPEPVPAPESVTRAQAKKALFGAGLLSLVQPAIDTIEDESERTVTQIDWDDAPDFRRSSPTIASLGAALGLTDSQIDDLFRTAGGL